MTSVGPPFNPIPGDNQQPSKKEKENQIPCKSRIHHNDNHWIEISRYIFEGWILI